MAKISFKRSLICGAITFALFTVYWALGQKFIIQKFESTIAEANASGYDVTHKGVGLSGFPLYYSVRIGTPNIAANQAEKPWAFRGENLYFKAPSWAPLRWNLHHSEDARIDIRGPKDQRWLFDVSPLKLDGDIALNLSGGLKTLDLRGRQIRPRDVIGTGPPVNSIEKMDISVDDIGTDARITLSLEDIFLNADIWANLQTVLGPRLERVTINMTAQGLDNIDSNGWDAFETDGILQSDAFRIQWNALQLSGKFTLKYGPNGLSGPVTLNVENERDLVDALEKAGLISKNRKTQVLFALQLAPKNEKGQREIPVNIADGAILFMGQPVYKF